jgi:fumarase (EC 4.2.1.2)
MIMIAKGNRSQQVTDTCQKHGGFYLGSIGRPAAILIPDYFSFMFRNMFFYGPISKIEHIFAARFSIVKLLIC